MTAATAGLHETTIVNPIERSTRITLPKSTHYRHRGATHVTGRSYEVLVHSASNGWVDTWNDAKKGCGYVRLPSITWAGSGGYWSDLRATPELCVILGLEMPHAPVLSEKV